MKKFKYKGYNSDGIAQDGTLEAYNYTEAYAALNYQGITVIELKIQKKDFVETLRIFYLKLKLGERWASIFFREISIMLGVMTLHGALKTLLLTTKNSSAQEILTELINSIENGQNFSRALSHYEIFFGSAVIQSIEIGETSGNLQRITLQLSSQLERNYVTMRKVRSAMYYPLFVLLIAIVSMIILVNVTLPIFESFFSERNTDLPLVTLILLYGGRFLSENSFLILFMLIMLSISMIIIIHKYSTARIYFDRLKLKFKILREVELRNFFGRLAFLLESGMPLDEAVRICASTSQNLIMKKNLVDISLSIARGETLGSQLKTKNFPALYVSLIITGESSGEVVNMLQQCESIADFEIEEILRGLPAKAEILGTLFAGLIVAILVFAVILPILDITNLF